MTRLPALALASFTLLLPLTACTDTDGDPQQADGSGTKAAPQASGFDTSYEVTNPPVSADAVHPFSVAEATTATEFAVQFVEDFTYREDTFRGREAWTQADFADLATRMTPESADWWNEHVEIWVNTQTDAWAQRRKVKGYEFTPKQQAAFDEAFKTLWQITIFGLDCVNCHTNREMIPAKGPEPVVTNPTVRIGKVYAYVDATGEHLLAVEVAASADLRMLVNNQPRLSRVTYKNNFALQPQPDGSWLLDGWNKAATHFGDPAPVASR